MTNPILNFSSNQSLSNPLVSESDAQALINASIATGGIPTFDNTVSYVTDDIVYYLGLFYIAPANISSGGGTPLANTAWKQIENWGSYTATASSAGTLTLTKYSNVIQRITGSTTHTIVLPVTSTLPALGKQYIVINSSSGAVAIQSSGANAIVSLTTNQYCILTCILLSGTTAASWHYTVTGLTPGDALTSGTLAQFAATTSAQLRGVISDETGSGVLVFADTPTLITPILGVATATSINKVTITAPATSATLTISNGKTLTATGSITIAGTDGKTLTVSNNITLAGTDGTVWTGPSSSFSVARIDAAQAFTGTQTWNNYTLLGETSGHLMATTLSADGKFSIAVGEIGVLGETLSVGHLVYFKAADSRWWKSDSDAEATSGPVKLAIVCVAGNAGDSCQLMFIGKIRADSLMPALTVGAPVHIGSTAGAIQVAAPTSGFVRVVGYADTADSIYFNPSSEYEERGTFDIGLTFGGSSVGITYANRTFSYLKKSRKFSFNGFVNLTDKGSSVGAAVFVNLPYASLYWASVTIGYLEKVSFANQIFAHSYTGSSILLYETIESGTLTTITDTDFQNTSNMVLSGECITS